MTNRTTYHCEEMPDGKIVCTPATERLMPVDLRRIVRRVLEWHPGPAIGGGGTAEHEEHAMHRSWWYDGQLLLVIVERNDGPEVSTVRVHADGDMLDFSNAATDDFDFGWTDQDISWWAILDDILPTNTKHTGA